MSTDAIYVIVPFVAVSLVVIFGLGVVLTKKNRDIHKVFYFNEKGDLIINVGLPVAHRVREINKIVLSCRYRRVGYVGHLKIHKTNGKKCRTYLFDASSYTKEYALFNTKQEIELAVEAVAAELRENSIPCEIISSPSFDPNYKHKNKTD